MICPRCEKTLCTTYVARGTPSMMRGTQVPCFSLVRSMLQWSYIRTTFSTFVFLLFYIITWTLQLNSQEVLPAATFWTSRGHSCRSFSLPLFLASFLMRISVFPLFSLLCSSICVEFCQLSAFDLSIGKN